MREADDNVAMFGFYIFNNVKIGFQTFATGLAFGLGTLFYLVFNGVMIGAVAGYLTGIGYGTPFWSFVSGHSAMELVAIAISGAAGLRLGAAVVAPGARSRKAALVDAARPAVRLMYGAAAMFFIAAFIEAFWSPLTAFPPQTKYAVARSCGRSCSAGSCSEGARVELEKLSVQLRPRGGWEALDLGCQMARSWWRPVWGVWPAVTSRRRSCSTPCSASSRPSPPLLCGG